MNMEEHHNRAHQEPRSTIRSAKNQKKTAIVFNQTNDVTDVNNTPSRLTARKNSQ